MLLPKSKSLIDSNINQDEFLFINNVLKEYKKIKIKKEYKKEYKKRNKKFEDLIKT